MEHVLQGKNSNDCMFLGRKHDPERRYMKEKNCQPIYSISSQNILQE